MVSGHFLFFFCLFFCFCVFFVLKGFLSKIFFLTGLLSIFLLKGFLSKSKFVVLLRQWLTLKHFWWLIYADFDIERLTQNSHKSFTSLLGKLSDERKKNME